MSRIKTVTWGEATADAVRSAGAYVSDFVNPTVRLGVTGLSRAGKTVFLTALVRNLVSGGRLPFFIAQAQGRLRRAYLVPQPDDDIPRFAYEEHLARLAGEPGHWPQGTTRISQLRLVIEYDSLRSLRRLTGAVTGNGPSVLNVDLIDYPGEWIVDLALLAQDYATWSEQALALARTPARANHAKPFLDFLGSLDPATAEPEPTAIEGAKLFTAYLAAARAEAPALSVLTPGRFLMPGDLAGSPLLTFLPLPPPAPGRSGRHTLHGLLARRFESYKAQVVKPFFRNHFSRLDRQIVLMDTLSALNQGPAGLADLADAMALVLGAFRLGANSLGSAIFRPRIDRIVFAATKADHLHHTSHDRLEALMRTLADRAIARAEAGGADVRVLALAALRATRETEVEQGNEILPCIVGTPMAGERVGDETFDGRRETVLFPGDLPADPKVLLDRGAPNGARADIRALTFQPPRLTLRTAAGLEPPLPHIRLDRAIDFLLGDHLV